MTKTEVDSLFEMYPYLLEIWTIGADYFFQNPDPKNELIGVKHWIKE